MRRTPDRGATGEIGAVATDAVGMSLTHRVMDVHNALVGVGLRGVGRRNVERG